MLYCILVQLKGTCPRCSDNRFYARSCHYSACQRIMSIRVGLDGNGDISEGSTKRKEILARFLDLEFFDQKYRAAKDDVSDLRGAVKRLEEKDYKAEIYEIEKNLLHLNNETEAQQEECDVLCKELENLVQTQTTLEATIDSIPTEIVSIEKVTRAIQEKNKQQEKTVNQVISLTVSCLEIIENSYNIF